MVPTQKPGVAKQITYLEAASDYFPAQVSGDTKIEPSTKTLPTLGKLLAVQQGDRFTLPNNELVQWILVQKCTDNLKRGNTTGMNDDEENDEPLWGFIPMKCLSNYTLKLIEMNYSACTQKAAKQDNGLMILKLAKMEQQLHEALEKNKSLHQKSKDEHSRITHSMHQLLEQLVEKGEHLEAAKQQIEILNKKLDKEIEYSAELFQKMTDFEVELEKYKVHANCNGSIVTDQNENEVRLSPIEDDHELLQRRVKNPITPIGDLMLSCTLCGERITLEEMEVHSSKCSSGSTRKTQNGKKEPNTPTSPGMLVATVTCCRRESTSILRKSSRNECFSPDPSNPDSCPFRIICKTTIPDYKKTYLSCERSKEDFMWFRNALEEFHPERVIPPLNFRDDLIVNTQEIQRFLSRICAHKVLKGDSLVRKFFSANAKELEKLKKSFKKQVVAHLKHHKPAIEVVDKDGMLYKTQVYISQLIENLTTLIEFFKTNSGEKSVEAVNECFNRLRDGEQNETYLKNVSATLGGIVAELENKKNVLYDQSALAEDLESILEFVKSTDELLYRVECAVNTFLYWEEEIRVFEEMKSEGLVTSSNGKDITHLWAEASSNCRTAKEELEQMCRDLSEELCDFDIRKEQEIKQVFLEYAQSRCDVFEKMQSKWFGVKLMLDADIVPYMRAIDFSSETA